MTCVHILQSHLLIRQPTVSKSKIQKQLPPFQGFKLNIVLQNLVQEQDLTDLILQVKCVISGLQFLKYCLLPFNWQTRGLRGDQEAECNLWS
jgi:hypothetical protein